jgi:preprotein translocase subunit SecG
MEAVILVIHLIVAVSLIIIILVQPSEAGGFMGSGSMSNLMAPRRGADVMTRTTTILAGCFFATSLFLAIAANHHPASKSILDVDPGNKKHAPAAPVTAPTNDNTAVPDKKADKTDKTDSTKKDKEPVKAEIPKAPDTK